MNFTSRKELDRFLNSLILLDTVGSQGVTYVNSKKKLVYKISHCYFDNELEYIDFSSESVSQFKNIESKAFIFPSDVITLNDARMFLDDPRSDATYIRDCRII